MKRLVSIAIIAVTFFSMGFVYEFHYPKLKEWAKTLIYLQSYDKLPVIIKVEDVELSPFTLSAQLEDITIIPKAELAKTISTIKVASIDVSASLISLLLGRFEISSIVIDKPELSFIHKKDPAAPPFKMPDIEFADLLKIPVDELYINEGKLLGRLDDIGQSVQITPLDVMIRKGFSSIFLEVKLPEVRIKEKNIEDSMTVFGFYTKLIVNNKSTRLIDLRINKDTSFLVAKGETQGNPLQLEFNTPTLVASWNLQLNGIKNWISSYNKNIQLPSLAGNFEGNLNLVGTTKGNTLSIVSNIVNLVIEDYDIGNIQIQAQQKNDLIEGVAKIQNGIQDIELGKLKIFLDNRYSFEGNINAKSFELNKLLQQLNVGATSLRLLAKTSLPCSGEVLPSFYVNCDGEINVQDFYIRGSPTSKNIVAIKNFTANGKLHVNTNFLVADAKLKLGQSTGLASTRVDFKKGYRVDYSSDNFQLSDVQEISGLSIKGKTKVNGYSEGTSKKGTFVIQTEAQDAYFEDYHLGNLTTKISYDSPHLRIQNIQGNIENTSYNGNIALNFNNDTIDIDVKAPTLNLSHLPKIISNKISMPLNITGSGNLQAHIFGPLDVNQLSYNIHGQLYRVLLGKESIDSIRINTSTTNNVVNLSGSEIIKAKSKIRLGGTLHTNGKMNIDFIGSDIRLEESESIQSITPNLNSLVQLNGKIRGTMKNPDIEATAILNHTTIGSAYYKEGKIEFKGNKESGITRANLFNNQLIGSIQWNYDTKTPLLIEAIFNNWDYSPVFSLVTSKNEREGFNSNLSGKIFVQYDLNDIVQSKVNLEIYKFLLSRGILDLRNKEIMLLNYSKDGLSLKDFELYGSNGTNIKVTASNPKPRQVNLQSNGNINIALLSFLTPFLNDVRGQFTYQANFHIQPNSIEAIGTAKMTDGYAKLNDFPAPFEKIEADYSFSQNRIAINRFRAELGGGLVRGSGNIAINGIQNVPVRIEAVVDNTTINLSKGLELTTSGNLTMNGTWFPYILSGNFDVKRGLISQDESESKNRIQKSYLLPEALKKQKLNPIELDIKASLVGRNIKVVNEFVNTSIGGSLHITGNPVKPTINGNITQAEKGFIQFNENTFDIDNMNVTFNNDQNMNPDLYVLANTRVKDYDITMTVGGNLQDIRPSFTSQPPLNEADIITLLTLGYTSATSEESTEPSSSGNAIGLGSAIINRNPLNKQIEDKTGISVKFNSAVDSADENITVPKVEVSKKWGNKLETKASRTFGKTLKNDAKVQYKINDKVSVIGSWEAESNTDNSEFKNTNKEDVFGVDLEYKIEFK